MLGVAAGCVVDASFDAIKSAADCKVCSRVSGCSVAGVLQLVLAADFGNRSAGLAGAGSCGSATDFLYGGDYGAGNAVYAGFDPVLRFPQGSFLFSAFLNCLRICFRVYR